MSCPSSEDAGYNVRNPQVAFHKDCHVAKDYQVGECVDGEEFFEGMCYQVCQKMLQRVLADSMSYTLTHRSL